MCKNCRSNFSNSYCRQKSSVAALNFADAYTSYIQNYYSSSCARILQLRGDERFAEAWKLVDSICGRKQRLTVQIAFLFYLACFSLKFASILSSNSSSSRFRSSCLQFYPFTSLSELPHAANGLRAGEISAELLKLSELHPILLEIINNTFISGKVLDGCLSSLLIPVPDKNGGLSSCNDYLKIPLTSVTTKLYNRLLLERLKMNSGLFVLQLR